MRGRGGARPRRGQARAGIQVAEQPAADGEHRNLAAAQEDVVELAGRRVSERQVVLDELGLPKEVRGKLGKQTIHARHVPRVLVTLCFGPHGSDRAASA